MKYITFILLAILGGLHFQIWKPGGLRAQYAEASAQAADFASRNEGARINNNILRAEVEDLKKRLRSRNRTGPLPARLHPRRRNLLRLKPRRRAINPPVAARQRQTNHSSLKSHCAFQAAFLL